MCVRATCIISLNLLMKFCTLYAYTDWVVGDPWGVSSGLGQPTAGWLGRCGGLLSDLHTHADDHSTKHFQH